MPLMGAFVSIRGKDVWRGVLLFHVYYFYIEY